MIAASVLGLPAIFLLITVLPCIRMGHEPGAAKYRRSQLGGILIILLGKAPTSPACVQSWRSVLLQDGVVQAGSVRSPESVAVQAGLSLKLSGIAVVSGVGKRHEWEWEDEDRSQGVKQGDEGRAVKPPLCVVLQRPRAQPQPVSVGGGQQLHTGSSLEALVLLVCCGNDANFGKGSKPPACLQGRNILQISLSIADAAKSL